MKSKYKAKPTSYSGKNVDFGEPGRSNNYYLKGLYCETEYSTRRQKQKYCSLLE